MKTNDKITRLLSTVLGSSILFASCEGDVLLLNDKIKFKREYFSENTPYACLPYDLDNYLQADEIEMVDSIRKLVCEITSNPQSALLFSQEPDILLGKYGLQDTAIECDSVGLMILQSLCKQEALQALKNEDFVYYLDLLREYGIPIDEALKDIKDQVQKKQVVTRAVGDLSACDISREKFECVWGVLAFAFLYVVAATIAAVEVAAVVDFAVKVTGPSLPKEKPTEEKKTRSVIETNIVLENAARSLGLTQKEIDKFIDMAKESLLIQNGKR